MNRVKYQEVMRESTRASNPDLVEEEIERIVKLTMKGVDCLFEVTEECPEEGYLRLLTLWRGKK